MWVGHFHLLPPLFQLLEGLLLDGFGLVAVVLGAAVVVDKDVELGVGEVVLILHK